MEIKTPRLPNFIDRVFMKKGQKYKKLKPLTEIQLAWLAGLLEGEGSFLKGPPSSPSRPGISMVTTDEDVIQRVADIFDVTYFAPKTRGVSKKQQFVCFVRGAKAVALMKLLYPHMSARRKLQINEALACYKPTKELRV